MPLLFMIRITHQHQDLKESTRKQFVWLEAHLRIREAFGNRLLMDVFGYLLFFNFMTGESNSIYQWGYKTDSWPYYS